jgi:hypothetical protein
MSVHMSVHMSESLMSVHMSESLMSVHMSESLMSVHMSVHMSESLMSVHEGNRKKKKSECECDEQSSTCEPGCKKLKRTLVFVRLGTKIRAEQHM